MRHGLLSMVSRPIARSPTHNMMPVTDLTPLLFQQCRFSSIVNDDNVRSTNRLPKSSARESWVARKRKQRSTRKKISTLALEQSPAAFQPVADAESTRNGSHEQQDRAKRSDQVLTRKQRRLLFWVAILTLPVWGRDVVEAVVPGLLGIFIMVGGKIKAGIKRIKSSSQQSKG